MRPLLPKQARFVEEYLIDLNATQAAIRAGYSAKTAYSQGQRLLKHVEIQASLARHREEQAKRTAISADWVIARLVANHDRALQAEPVMKFDRAAGRLVETGEYVYDGAVANRSLELIGKHLAMFTDNTNLRTPDGPLAVAVTYEIVEPSAH